MKCEAYVASAFRQLVQVGSRGRADRPVHDSRLPARAILLCLGPTYHTQNPQLFAAGCL